MPAPASSSPAGRDYDLALLREVKRRRECRRSFLAFCIEALRPFGQTPAAHHRFLINELQRLADGEIDRLMVLMPPGSAKSFYATRLFSAWLLARGNMKIIGASHTGELADDFSSKIQDHIRENAGTLGYGLKSKAVGRWYTTNRGAYLAAGVRSGIPGFRANCVTGDTKVTTLAGEIPIKRVAIGTQTGYVLSYDERTQRPEFRRVLAVSRRHADTLWRIRTTAGRMVEATADHRFHTGRGWVAASALVVGDVLLCAVRQIGAASRGGGHEVSRTTDVLRQAVFDLHDEHECAGLYRSCLPGVRQTDGGGAARPQDLFARVSARKRCREGGEGSDSAAASMRDVRHGFPPGEQYPTGQVLQSPMQGPRACRPDIGSGESRVAGRRECSAPSARVVGGKAPGMGARPAPLRGLPIGQRPTSAPHQPRPFGPRSDEPGHALSHTSSAAACGGTLQAEQDIVAMVERICRDCDVFDIQVEGTECFFADGVLVHNCAIIDDPIKGRAAADSEADRKQVWDWYNGDLERRLTPGAWVLLVMTPWHELDLAGELLRTEGDRWRVVRLPAEAEAGDMLGRQPGEWLWGDDAYGYGADLIKIKAALAARGAAREWSSQYQGRPVPATGDYFKAEWLRTVETLPPRKELRIFGASDYAVTDDGGDFTVHVVVGIDTDDRVFVLDLWRGQTASDKWVEAFCDLVIQWKPLGWAEELGQIKAGVGPWLTRRMRERRAFVAREAFPTRGDKSVRAQSIRGRAALSGLYIVADAPFRADLETEMLSFPAGRHDDQVDALGLAGQLLDMMIAPRKAAPPPPPRDSWERAFERADDDGESHKTA